MVILTPFAVIELWCSFGSTSAFQNVENVNIDNILSDSRRELSAPDRRCLKGGYFYFGAFRLAKGLEVFLNPIAIVFPIGILPGFFCFLFSFSSAKRFLSFLSAVESKPATKGRIKTSHFFD